jgi:hypothetical protein
MMYSYTRKSRKLAENVSELLRGNDILLENNYAEELLGITYRAENGVLYWPQYFVRFKEHILKIKMVIEYYVDTAEAEYAILFETPMDWLVEKRIEVQLMVMKHLVGL